MSNADKASSANLQMDRFAKESKESNIASFLELDERFENCLNTFEGMAPQRGVPRKSRY